MSAMGWSSLTGKPSGLKLVNAGSIHDTDRSMPAAASSRKLGIFGLQLMSKMVFHRQAGLAEVAEPLMVAQAVMNIGEAQRPRVEGIPAPGDVVGVQVTDEGGLVVQRRHIGRPVIPASGRHTHSAYRRLGSVEPGTEANQRSQTANSPARWS